MDRLAEEARNFAQVPGPYIDHLFIARFLANIFSEVGLPAHAEKAFTALAQGARDKSDMMFFCEAHTRLRALAGGADDRPSKGRKRYLEGRCLPIFDSAQPTVRRMLSALLTELDDYAGTGSSRAAAAPAAVS